MNTIGTLNATDGTAVLSTQKAAYGDNPFLKLLTEQLKNQTPLEPVDNASFMNQMASYTTMQEQRDLNSNMLKLLDFQGVLARVNGLSQGSSLLGKDVSYAGEDGKAVTAKVESVFVSETGDVRLKLAGGKEIDLREVLGIAETATTTTAGTGTGTTGSTTAGTGTSGGAGAGTGTGTSSNTSGNTNTASA